MILCELCGEPLGDCLQRRKRRVQQPCSTCCGDRKGAAKEARRKKKLAQCGHYALDLGKRADREGHLEYHAGRREMADIAAFRKEAGLPWLWNGEKWVWPEEG